VHAVEAELLPATSGEAPIFDRHEAELR
jgi:hypothetical protein